MADHQDPGTVREGQKAGAGAEPLFRVCVNQSSDAAEKTAGNHWPSQSPVLDIGLSSFSKFCVLPSLYTEFSFKRIHSRGKGRFRSSFPNGSHSPHFPEEGQDGKSRWDRFFPSPPKIFPLSLFWGQGLYSMTWAVAIEIQTFPRLSDATPSGTAGREYW